MKTRMKKMIMIAAALLFATSGVAFAHDWNDRNHKPPGKAYGHYKVQKQRPGWNTGHFKSKHRIPQKYVYKKVRNDRYYHGHQRRPAARRNVIYKVAKKEPVVVFKLILKDFR
jgi:hypothetical protein